MRSRMFLAVFLAVLAVGVIAFTVACGGGSTKQSSSAMVSTTLSDPPTCAAPSGSYQHVWVTISDVEIHTSASASATDAGWVDLTPGLKTAPKQVDLLSLGGTGCVLAQLGSETNIPAGTYQQIRVFLAPNSTNIANNACGNAGANCVVVNGSTTQLSLSSETQTGIKIPSGQIAGGAFTVNAGENKSLDIDFDACASIVMMSGGGYRLKPTMHAGEVALVSNAVTGQLVDASTKQPIANAKEIVALEQKDANGIDRVIMQITPDVNGNFNICPVPAGTYDIVAVAIVTSGSSTATSYSASITTGVQPGFALGMIPMYVQPTTGPQQGLISGLITTANTSSAGTATDISVFALLPVTSGTTTVSYTIPLAQQQASSINVTTAAGSSCPSGTDCVTYQLGVPAAQPYIGAYAPTGATYTQVVGTAVNYTVDALAFVTGGGASPSCSPSEVQVTTTTGNLPLAVVSGQTTNAANATFTGCQ